MGDVSSSQYYRLSVKFEWSRRFAPGTVKFCSRPKGSAEPSKIVMEGLALVVAFNLSRVHHYNPGEAF